MEFCNGKGGDWDKEEMRVTLHWYFSVYLKPLNIFRFFCHCCL